MRLARLAMFIMGFIIVIAITKGALVLLIPILAIMIPIIAIVSFSPIGKAIAQSINGGVINNSGISVNDFNQLKEKYDEVMNILKVFTYTITHVRREKNKIADSLANQAIDRDGDF